MSPTAAALVIGTEILTGKIREANLTLLARELFRLGIELRRVVVCPDHIDTIADDVDHLRTRHDWLVTSGGIGPTHDDLTVRAVAQALGRPIVLSESLLKRIEEFVGDRGVTDGHRRMAEVPEGAELLWTAEVPWPTVLVENVFVLPGLPRIFEMKMQLLRQHLAGGEPFLTRSLYTLCRESEIAAPLEKVAQAHPEVAIGSYPVWGTERGYSVKLTVDGRALDEIDRALAAVKEIVPGDLLVDPPAEDD